MKINAKGFLVVSSPIDVNGIFYHGVNTNAWPLGEQFEMELAQSLCELSYCDLSFPLLVDFESALRYSRMCEKATLIPRMLYCEVLTNCTTYNLPHFEKPQNSIFLGYDYAYPSGDYYSAIVNDIIAQGRPLAKQWKKHLNEFGLLPTKDELIEFIRAREALVEQQKENAQGTLCEIGFFVGFRVFLVNYKKES